MDKFLRKISEKGTYIVLFIVVFLATLSLIYWGSRPKQYSLHVNDVSPVDIEAPRTVVDRNASERRASEARSQVADVYSRSEELSKASLERVTDFFVYYSNKRTELKEMEADKDISEGEANHKQMAAAIYEELSSKSEYFLSVEDIEYFLTMSQSRFSSLRTRSVSTADVIMKGAVPGKELNNLINLQLEQFQSSIDQYSADLNYVKRILQHVLKTNLVFNEEATLNAMNDAYERVMQNPILVNRGSRIVSAGQIISEDIYAILKDLNLLDSKSIDYDILAGQAILVLIVMFILSLYLENFEKGLIGFNRNTLTILTAMFLPLVVSAYLGQDFQVGPPVYFTAVIISTYFGYRTAVVVTMSLIVLTLPLVNFNPAFIVVAICGSLLAAHFTQDLVSQDKFAKLIIAIGLVNLLSGLSFTLMQGGSYVSAGITIASGVISAVLSVVGAIGLMPLIEMLFNVVSPTGLIELSQPGHPLMKRLFLEAPGTSQHSMMVANLADAAAEAIGADAMICRVGAYYHDIGKLENPAYFSENQNDGNMHDQLPPEESTKIITRHTLAGLDLGKKYRLPKPILDIIVEHHGTTVLGYFYSKAKKYAKENNLEDPNPEDFRYKGQLPSSPESAVVMLADSTEAAVKSVKSNNMEDVAEMIRSVFKIKLEQNQLKNSGLGFADVDKIMQAFLQVYTGYFHERVQYPKEKNEKSEHYNLEPAK